MTQHVWFSSKTSMEAIMFVLSAKHHRHHAMAWPGSSLDLCYNVPLLSNSFTCELMVVLCKTRTHITCVRVRLFCSSCSRNVILCFCSKIKSTSIKCHVSSQRGYVMVCVLATKTATACLYLRPPILLIPTAMYLVQKLEQHEGMFVFKRMAYPVVWCCLPPVVFPTIRPIVLRFVHENRWRGVFMLYSSKT